MVQKVRIGPYSRDVAETMFAWNGENKRECNGYKLRSRRNSNVKVPKTTGCGPLS